MLNNTTKNLLCVILTLCFLLQGCKSHQPLPLQTITQQVNIPERPQTKKKDSYSFKDLSKEELEQEIQEAEEYFIEMHDDSDPDEHPGKRIGRIIGALFMPIMIASYFGAKVEYAERYGTPEQKQFLKDLKTSSNDPSRQHADMMKILEFHPAVYDFSQSQPQLPESLLPENRDNNLKDLFQKKE